MPPWVDMMRFTSSEICEENAPFVTMFTHPPTTTTVTPEMATRAPGAPSQKSDQVVSPTTIDPNAPCEGKGTRECPGVIEQGIPPGKPGSYVASQEFKCIIQKLIVRKFKKLRTTLTDRYNQVRMEALR